MDVHFVIKRCSVYYCNCNVFM